MYVLQSKKYYFNTQSKNIILCIKITFLPCNYVSLIMWTVLKSPTMYRYSFSLCDCDAGASSEQAGRALTAGLDAECETWLTAWGRWTALSVCLRSGCYSFLRAMSARRSVSWWWRRGGGGEWGALGGLDVDRRELHPFWSPGLWWRQPILSGLLDCDGASLSFFFLFFFLPSFYPV